MRHNYQQRAENYISSIIRHVSELDYVVSVIVFGSYVSGDLTHSSDVDVMVIVSDDTDSNKMKALDKEINMIQLRFGLRTPENKFPNKLFNFISKQTGIAVSCFICKESGFKNLDFIAIFKTSKFLTKMLAPTSLIFIFIIGHVFDLDKIIISVTW